MGEISHIFSIITLHRMYPSYGLWKQWLTNLLFIFVKAIEVIESGFGGIFNLLLAIDV